MVLELRANFARTDVAAICQRLGATVGPLPGGVDGAQLLWAMSGVESSFGANCQPRHEPAFDVRGVYATHYPMTILLPKYGSAAACSYGPWQLMFCNAPLTYAPGSFDSLLLAAQATLSFLCQQLRAKRPQSLAEIGEVWNTGGVRPDLAYVAKLQAAYDTPMPEV